MKISNVDIDIYSDILFELSDKFPKVTVEVIDNVVKDFFKITSTLIGYGSNYNNKPYIKRIILPNLGSFVFNNAKFRKANEGKLLDLINVEDSRRIHHYLYLMGWGITRWTKKYGYMFYNEYSGETYNVDKDFVRGHSQAEKYFYNYVTYNEKSNLIDELRYNGRLIKYDYIKDVYEYIEDYDSLLKDYEEDVIEILKSIIYNSRKQKAVVSKQVGGYIWIKEMDKDREGIFRPPRNNVKHSYDIDIIDKDTNEIVYKAYGDVRKCAKFVKSIRYGNPNPSNITRVLGTDKVLYGWKWKKS